MLYCIIVVECATVQTSLNFLGHKMISLSILKTKRKDEKENTKFSDSVGKNM